MRNDKDFDLQDLLPEFDLQPNQDLLPEFDLQSNQDLLPHFDSDEDESSVLSPINPAKIQKNVIEFFTENFLSINSATQKTYKDSLFSPIHEMSRKPSKIQSIAKIFGVKNIRGLFSEILKIENSHFRTLGINARFVVTQEMIGRIPTGKLILSYEGQPNNHILSHPHMVKNRKSKTAGNIFFNEDFKIYAVSNKTGHYRAPFETLAWTLAILYYCAQEHLADEIQLIQSPSDKAEYSIKRSEIPVLCRKLFSNQEIIQLKKINATAYEEKIIIAPEIKEENNFSHVPPTPGKIPASKRRALSSRRDDSDLSELQEAYQSPGKENRNRNSLHQLRSENLASPAPKLNFGSNSIFSPPRSLPSFAGSFDSKAVAGVLASPAKNHQLNRGLSFASAESLLSSSESEENSPKAAGGKVSGGSSPSSDQSLPDENMSDELYELSSFKMG